MPSFPVEQIQDAHKLTADGLVDLYRLYPVGGTPATVYFKPDNTVTWQGNEYFGMPLKFSGDNVSSQTGAPQPRMTIGQENTDLALFKPLIYDGYLDGAIIQRLQILLDDLINNRNLATIDTYRIRRIPSYNRSLINLELSRKLDSLDRTLPSRQFIAPAFPAVTL